jgi:hypothetical protein
MSTTYDPAPVVPPPAKPGKRWHQRWSVRILGALIAGLAIGAGAFGATAGHHPARTTAAAQSYQDEAACRDLAAATAAIGSTPAPYDPGPYTKIAVAVQEIQDTPASEYSPGFRRDVLAVIGDPAKPGYGLYTPSAQQVAVLQADCAAHGVTGPIWPSSLTAAGN